MSAAGHRTGLNPAKELKALQLSRRRKPGPHLEDVVHGSLSLPKMVGRGPSIITDNFVLGSRDDSQDFQVLSNLGISHVLNVAVQLPNAFEDSFVYEKIDLHDSPSTDVRALMPRARAYLRRVEKLNGRVLIHCISGVSRSVTVLIMYFIMEHSMRLEDVYNYVKRMRPFIAPNDGFKLQLALCEIDELGFSSVSTSGVRDWNFYAWNKVKKSYKTVRSAEITSSTVCIIM